MNQSTSPSPEHRLWSWHQGPLGQLLARHERHVIRPALEDAFGLHMLQVGSWGEPGKLIQGARTQRQFVVGQGPVGQPQVCSSPSSLAIASDTVDAVLLPHTLELEIDPYAVLREAQRVLVGDGRLLILGFAPAGLWALRHRFATDGFPPGLTRLISERRLREWLTLLGFEVGASIPYLPRVPWSRRLSAEGERISDGGGLLDRFLGSAYLLKARKRVYMVTPLRPRWRERRTMVGGLVEPTTRNPFPGARSCAPAGNPLDGETTKR